MGGTEEGQKDGQGVDEEFPRQRRQGSTFHRDVALCADTENGKGCSMFQACCKVPSWERVDGATEGVRGDEAVELGAAGKEAGMPY